MKLKKKGMFGLLLALLVFVGCNVVYAATAITAEQFKTKMAELGYDVVVLGDSGYAYPKGTDSYDYEESYVFEKVESVEEAQKKLDELYEEADGEKKVKRSSVTSGNTTCITMSGEEDGEFAYLKACRIDDTVVMGVTINEDKIDTVNSVLKDLGYNASSSLVLFIVLGVVVVVIVAAIIILNNKKKKNNNMNQNVMYPGQNANYNQPQPMNQIPNQFVNPPMDQGMSFGQPQPMDQAPNQFVNPPIDQGTGFGQPQPMNQTPNQFVNPPMDQGMSFGQPQPMDQDFNNNPMNNNFPNIN